MSSTPLPLLELSNPPRLPSITFENKPTSVVSTSGPTLKSKTEAMGSTSTIISPVTIAETIAVIDDRMAGVDKRRRLGFTVMR